MKVLLCAIVKNENHYLQEWVDHYHHIGVDKIVIFDNNDKDGERIEVDGVEVINFRGYTCCQQRAYNECYTKYSMDYDWFLFLDIDEFLETTKPLKEWLFNPIYAAYDGIKVNWMNMTDSGLICVENGDYGRHRFIEPLDKWSLYNRQCKTIVRGSRQLHFGDSVHCPDGNLDFCDVLGHKRGTGNRTPMPIWEVAHIKHYRTRTIGEYIDCKMKRLYPDQSAERARAKLTLAFFWKFNRYTKEKEDYARRRLYSR